MFFNSRLITFVLGFAIALLSSVFLTAFDKSVERQPLLVFILILIPSLLLIYAVLDFFVFREIKTGI